MNFLRVELRFRSMHDYRGMHSFALQPTRPLSPKRWKACIGESRPKVSHTAFKMSGARCIGRREKPHGLRTCAPRLWTPRSRRGCPSVSGSRSGPRRRPPRRHTPLQWSLSVGLSVGFMALSPGCVHAEKCRVSGPGPEDAPLGQPGASSRRCTLCRRFESRASVVVSLHAAHTPSAISARSSPWGRVGCAPSGMCCMRCAVGALWHACRFSAPSPHFAVVRGVRIPRSTLVRHRILWRYASPALPWTCAPRSLAKSHVAIRRGGGAPRRAASFSAFCSASVRCLPR